TQAAGEAAGRAAAAATRRDAAVAALEEAARAAGFADAAAARAAQRPPAALAALKEDVEQFGRALHQAELAAARAAAEIAGLAPPDLDALAAAEAAAREALRQARDAAGRLAERLAATARRLANIRAAGEALEAARAAHLLVSDLAETARGKNDRKLSLQGFVLAGLLDEALSAANQRLQAMLGGRFSLRRREEPGRAIGLDIEVLDEWTGQPRPAATLSGGEGFCAALALALGLADTVQAHAGARRIDALFIDEGFGTLDEEALDRAMDILASLPAGDRLVGIISHVAELR
ncbi:SbcC/MukB-like Walker B domain-containing protein, partial [Teichococcus deserti]|uniref:SbcC/MukB-like Walker B domain-containing protein n=1 Tax=Teichococcus deserti TaxID=1817963 RepID=UPI0010549E81